MYPQVLWTNQEPCHCSVTVRTVRWIEHHRRQDYFTIFDLTMEAVNVAEGARPAPSAA
jgi:hypothetical protein